MSDGFPRDLGAWLHNAGVALPLMREAVMESLGVAGERLTRDERVRFDDVLREALDDKGLDVSLSEGDLLDIITTAETVDDAGQDWLRRGAPSRIVALVAAQTADAGLVSAWRGAVEDEDYRAEANRQDMADGLAEDE